MATAAIKADIDNIVYVYVYIKTGSGHTELDLGSITKVVPYTKVVFIKANKLMV